MKLEYIECGEIVKPQGIKGEVKVYPWSDDADFLLDFETVYIGKEKAPYKLLGGRVMKQMTILSLEGVETANDAQRLRNSIVYIKRSDAKLEEGKCFISEMLGMDVVDFETGEKYGVMTDFSETGANNIYHVKFPNGKVYLIPAIDQVVKKISLEENKIYISVLDGLFEINDGKNDDYDGE